MKNKKARGRSVLALVLLIGWLCVGCASARSEIRITNTYTHTAPQDDTIAKRYVFTSDENTLLAGHIDEIYGGKLEKAVWILYADDSDVPLAEYTYLVFETEQDGRAFNESYEEASPYRQEGNVLYYSLDRPAVKEAVTRYQKLGLAEDTASAYAAYIGAMVFNTDAPSK